ncbi:hypothetical protein A2313_02910 [Candidatus Roizmanbacteria bacterium RIFOXYB2_FULL_41_10]|nr:MAG: hypothetical protein A2313_02910 [Candidatus Roizmanbacteria bacterium RIFOXYB2_FULL_41_10]
MKNNLMVTVIVAVVVGGLGFFGGMQYQKASARPSATVGQFQAQNGQARPEGFPTREGTGSKGASGINPVSGEILEIDNKTITIKTQDGSSKIVIYSGSTNINKTSEGSMDDLQVGEEVMVIGTQDTNGTLTAQTISIGGRGFRGIPEQEIDKEQ